MPINFDSIRQGYEQRKRNNMEAAKNAWKNVISFTESEDSEYDVLHKDFSSNSTCSYVRGFIKSWNRKMPKDVEISYREGETDYHNTASSCYVEINRKIEPTKESENVMKIWRNILGKIHRPYISTFETWREKAMQQDLKDVYLYTNADEKICSCLKEKVKQYNKTQDPSSLLFDGEKFVKNGYVKLKYTKELGYGPCHISADFYL